MENQTVVLTRGPRAAGLTGVLAANQPSLSRGEPDADAVALDPASATAASPRSGKCPLHTMFAGFRVDVPFARRATILATGITAYLMFFGTILYMIGFLANLVVPKGIDSGSPGALWPSLIANTALLALFVVQHTIMARTWFKRRWTRLVPECIERSIFVAAASACLMFLCWLWQPMPRTIWHFDQPLVRWMLVGISMSGWAVVFASSFMINHFDLFGLRQMWHGAAGSPRPPVPFVLTGFYKFVRHPLMVGFLIAIWVTPTMSVGHLFFAIMATSYIFFGTAMEERDLVAHLGQTYRDYRSRVRAFVPVPRHRH